MTVGHDPELVKDAQQHHRMGIDELTQVLPMILKAIIERQAWEGRERKDGKLFTSFYEFARAPLWHGLGMTGEGRSLSYEDAIRYCDIQHKAVAQRLRAEVPALGKQGGTGANQHSKSRVDDIKSATEGGTSATYLVRRLKRDFPDIAKGLAAGEFKSVRAAALEAGIIKKPDPLAQIIRLLPKLTPAQIRKLRDIIATQHTGSP